MEELMGIKLEGKNYIIIDEIIINNIKYVHLALASNPEDFSIRKVIKEGQDDVLVPLDSDEEFELVLLSFAKEMNE